MTGVEPDARDFYLVLLVIVKGSGLVIFVPLFVVASVVVVVVVVSGPGLC